MDLKKLSMEELLHYEEAAKIVCTKYEKSASSYMDWKRDSEYDDEQKAFIKANDIYKKIVNEIERRVWEIS